MTSGRTRAGVVLLCLLAIVLAAAQFPATGLGSAPGGSGPTDDSAAGWTTGGVLDFDNLVSGGSGSVPTATPTPKRPTATPTDATTTAEETMTAAQASDRTGEGGSDGSVGPLAWVLIVAGLGAVVAIVWMRFGGTAGSGDENEQDGPTTISKPFGIEVGALEGSGSLFQRVSRATMAFVISMSASAPRLFEAAVDVADALAVGLGVAARETSRALGDTFGPGRDVLRGAFAGVGLGMTASVRSFPLGTSSILDGLFGTTSSVRSTKRPDRDGRDATEIGPAETNDYGPPDTIEEAWERMLDRATRRPDRAMTPVEVARSLISSGFPAEPVTRLTALFRQRRYGGVPPSDDRLEIARRALERIRRGEDS